MKVLINGCLYDPDTTPIGIYYDDTDRKVLQDMIEKGNHRLYSFPQEISFDTAKELMGLDEYRDEMYPPEAPPTNEEHTILVNLPGPLSDEYVRDFGKRVERLYKQGLP